MTRPAPLHPDALAELRAIGAPPPFAVRSSSEAVIVDADAKPIYHVLPGFPAADRMWLAEFAAAALNAACGIPAPPIEAPLDPAFRAALVEGSRGFMRRVSPGPIADAAE